MSKRLYVISSLFLLLVCLVPPTVAEDWPRWTGPYGRNFANEQNLPQTFDRNTMQNIKWETRLGEVAFGCPTVADGQIFIGTNMAAMRHDPRFSSLRGRVLSCLDEQSGERIWNLVSPIRTLGYPKNTHMIHQRWGICSSPTVDGDRVYVVTNGNDVLCLDVKGLRNGNDGPFQDEATFMAGEGNDPIQLSEFDADIIWRYDIPRELGVAPHDVASSSVLVIGNVLYLSTSNGIGKGSPVYALNREAPGFIALDKNSGELLAVENVNLSQNLFHAQWGSPSLAVVKGKPLILLGGADGICYAFDTVSPANQPSNSESLLRSQWQHDCNPERYKREANGRRIYYYQGDERVYKKFVNEKKSTGGFNNGNGNFIGPNEILGTPIFYKNRVYVATDRDPLHGLAKGILTCIDATGSGDATALWHFDGIGRSLSTVAIDDDTSFATDLQGKLYCIDALTGKLYWTHDTEDEIWGNPLIADGKIYVNAKNSFWIFSANRKLEILHHSRGGSECNPIAANGVVYVFIRGQLYALQKELDQP